MISLLGTRCGFASAGPGAFRYRRSREVQGPRALAPAAPRQADYGHAFEACSGFTRITARWIAQLPKATFVTKLRDGQLPDRPARQLPDQSTALWMDPPSTAVPRPRGALTPDAIMRRAKHLPRGERWSRQPHHGALDIQSPGQRTATDTPRHSGHAAPTAAFGG